MANILGVTKVGESRELPVGKWAYGWGLATRIAHVWHLGFNLTLADIALYPAAYMAMGHCLWPGQCL